MVSAVEARGLTKRYGERAAVRHLDLDVRAGEAYGFLGLNGAGKTTTVRMLTGVLAPTSGEARVLGRPVARGPAGLADAVGVVYGENLAPEPDVTPERYLRHFAALHGLPMADAKARALRLLDVLRLRDEARRPIGTLSGGNRRKVELARALLHAPRVLFLDEPTRELDIPAKRAVWAFLRGLREEEGLTLFLSSHDVQEIAALCTRIGILRDGVLAWEGTPAELAADGSLVDALADALEG